MNAKVGKKLDLRLKVFAFFGKELVLIFAFLKRMFYFCKINSVCINGELMVADIGKKQVY